MKISLRIVAVTLATAGALAPLPFAARRHLASSPQHMITVTGRVGEWRLTVDGTLYLRIQADYALEEGGTEREQIPEGGMWFYTPADRADDLQFEHMALEVVLAGELRPEQPLLTVRAKQERALEGDEPEEALPLEWIGRL